MVYLTFNSGSQSIMEESQSKSKAGAWSQSLKQRPCRNVAYPLVSVLESRGPGTALPPTQSLMGRIPPQTCLQANLTRAFSQLDSLLPEDPSLCQVDKNWTTANYYRIKYVAVYREEDKLTSLTEIRQSSLRTQAFIYLKITLEWTLKIKTAIL